MCLSVRVYRWGHWAPQDLNDNADWNEERGVNSIQILSFLLAAYAYTGNDVYLTHLDALVQGHGYGLNMVCHSVPICLSVRTVCVCR